MRYVTHEKVDHIISMTMEVRRWWAPWTWRRVQYWRGASDCWVRCIDGDQDWDVSRKLERIYLWQDALRLDIDRILEAHDNVVPMRRSSP